MRIVGHRGAPNKALENTLSSFEAALEMGVKAMELDVQLTKDWRLVVHHDKELGRTLEGKGLIAEFTLKELQAMKLKGGKEGEKIPSLEDVLSLCKGKAFVCVEAKSEDEEAGLMAGALVRCLKENSKPGNSGVISFCHSVISQVRWQAPEIWTGPSMREFHPAESAMSLDPAVVCMNHEFVNEKIVEPYREKSIQVWVYTVDDKKRAEELKATGVTGLITNRPDLFLS